MKNYFLAFSLLCISLLSAQGNKNVEEQQFKINFLSPAIVYEVGIQKNSTLYFELGTTFGLGLNSESDVDFGFFPLIETQYRHYYNFSRRLKKGKNIEANTANYVGLTTVYTSGDAILGDFNLDNSNNFFVGPVYGLQRTYKRGFNFGIEIGAGYFNNNGGQGIIIGADFTIGWVLGRKNKN